MIPAQEVAGESAMMGRQDRDQPGPRLIPS
jgi:hypothetical protein